jgi:hypothetical protein
MNGILNEIGLTPDKSQWINFDEVNLTTDDKRKEYLASLNDKLSN